MERKNHRQKVSTINQRGQVIVEVGFVVAIIVAMLVLMLKFHKGKTQVVEKDMQIKDMRNYKTKRSL